MQVLYVNSDTFKGILVNFEDRAVHSVLGENAKIVHLADNPLRLPWQLRKMLAGEFEGEKVIIHARTPRAVVSACEAAEMAGKSKPFIVFSPFLTTDKVDLARLGKYAQQCSCTLLAQGSEMAQKAKETWEDKINLLTIPAPAIPPTSNSGVPEGKRLLFQGEITPASNLEEAVKALTLMPDVTLTVNGTGKGRYAMPAVKLGRHLKVDNRIDWAGNAHDSEIIPADEHTLLLMPELSTDCQQIIAASYAAQGVKLLGGRPSAQEIADTVAGSDSFRPLNWPWQSLESFFSSLLDVYRSL